MAESRRSLTRLLVWWTVLLSVAALPCIAQGLESYIVARGTYRGQDITAVVVPGRPPAFRMPAVALPRPDRSRGVNVLASVPTLTWCFGCSATSAAMMMGYYDNLGYPAMYAGPTNGGAFPMTNSAWPDVVINGETRAQCPLSATRDGVDGRTGRGHVDDYWIIYNTAQADPWISNGWTQHAWSDCTADFMGTNQSAYGNPDGSTVFWYFNNGSPLHDYSACEPGSRDGCHGMRAFAESRGYSVVDNYTQLIYPNPLVPSNTTGFTFAQFKAEIDAGRPVLIHVEGHTMLGLGYDDVGSTVYLHDTWDWNTHTMSWAGAYSTLRQWGATTLQLSTTLVPQVALSINGGATNTTSLNVTLGLTHTGGNAPTEVRLANDTGSGPGTWSDWRAWASSIPWNLAAGGDGSRKVWVEARNASGTGSAVSDSITYTTPTAAWTFLVYLDADNNLESYGVADLNEMERVGSSAGVNIVVQMDRIGGYDTSNGNWTGARRYFVTQDSDTSAISSTLRQDLGEVNMGAPATLQDFINWGVANYPAQKYALVFWDHGGGWRSRLREAKARAPLASSALKALCWDDTSGGDCLYTKEWAGAIATAGTDFALVGFDVCLAGMIEPAYELWQTGRTNAMVGSPPTEPGEGWPYDTILGDLVGNPAMSGAQAAQAVVTRYGQRYPTLAMAAYDLTQIPQVLSTVNNLVTQLAVRTDWATAVAGRLAAQDYYSVFRDLRGFVEYMRDHTADAAVRSAATSCATTLNSFVTSYCSGADYPGGRGLSVSFPNTGLEAGYTDANIAWAGVSQWDEFLAGLATAVPPPAPSLNAISNLDGDGNYDVGWSAVSFVGTVGGYRLDEWTGGTLLSDDAEGTCPWQLGGYTISATRARSGAHSYYSGIAGSLRNELRLTNAVALPGTGTSTLRFWAWYDTEPNWDFLYVDASSDGGAHWTTLASYDGSATVWAAYAVNLSAYNGQSVLVRFRYETDEIITYEGVYLDDITITNLLPTGGTWAVDSATTSVALTGRTEGTWAYTVQARSTQGFWSTQSNLERATVIPAPIHITETGAAFHSIQAAIGAATTGQHVVVSPGTYHERLDFLGKAITVTSTNPTDPSVVAATIINADGGGSVVTFNTSETASAVLTGFTITHGTGRGVAASSATALLPARAEEGLRAIGTRGAGTRGGGIYVGTASPTIVGNVITGNMADTGGGVFCGSGTPTLRGNIIETNVATTYGGGIYTNAAALMEANTIHENTATNGGAGVAVAWVSARATLTGNLIAANHQLVGSGGGGAGVHCFHANLTATGNCFSANTSDAAGGGMAAYSGDLVLRNNLFVGNTAVTRGAAFSNESLCTVLFEHNTVYGNTAASGQGSIYQLDGQLTLRNCLITGALAGGGVNIAGGTVALIYSDLWGNAGGDQLGLATAGTGCISADPVYADAAAGDFHLRSPYGRFVPATSTWVKDTILSAGVDAGDPASPYALEPFPNGGRVNMGAYGNTAEASKGGNHDPTTPTSVVISPVAPRPLQDLTASATGSTDPDGDAITYEYQWACRPLNGVWGAWEDGGATLSGSRTAKGQQWKARARANDLPRTAAVLRTIAGRTGIARGVLSRLAVVAGRVPEHCSDWKESAVRNIGDGLPAPPTRVWIEKYVTMGKIVARAEGGSDPDGDAVNYLYQWRRWDTTPTPGWTIWGWTGCNPIAGVTKGQKWQIRAQSRSGYPVIGSAWVEGAEFIMPDTAPTTPTYIALGPYTVFDRDDLTASTAGSTDPDPGDTVSYVYEWSYKSGLTWTVYPYIGKVFPNQLTTPGQQWRVRAKAEAGSPALQSAYGAYSITKTILPNPAPRPAGVSIVAATAPNGAVQITLSLLAAAEVQVRVLNLAGRELVVLAPGTLAAGTRSVLWNGRSSSGTLVPRGQFVVRVEARQPDGTVTAASVPLVR